MSPKSDKIFKLSQWYSIWSLARIRHLVQEIGADLFLVKTWKFYSFYSVVTLKIRARSPKSKQIFKPFQRYNLWSLARLRHLVQEIRCRQASFGQNLKINFYSVVTLKIRSRSPSSNQIFKPSRSYNTWSLTRIRHLIQEIGCRQAIFGQNL